MQLEHKKVQSVKTFQPFTITITFESLHEVENLKDDIYCNTPEGNQLFDKIVYAYKLTNN